MTVDAVVAENIQEELVKFTEYADFCFFPDIHKNANLDFRKFIPKKENVLFTHQEPVKFSKRLPIVGTGGTVIYEGFQILKYLGFSEIYFLGVDMNFVIHTNTEIIKGNAIKSKADDDPNHFDPRYFGKGQKYHQPDAKVMENMLSSLKILSKKLPSKKCKVANIGYDSEVKCFPKQDFEETLNYSEIKKEKLFVDLLEDFGVNSIEELLSISTELETTRKWSDSDKVQFMSTDEAQNYIKEKIFTHIPLGPYQGKVYFFRRND
jgi:hypothetical protein